MYAEPHPAVVRRVKGFMPSLTVEHNPLWMVEGQEGWKFSICEHPLMMTAVDDSGLCVIQRTSFPVLGIPQAMEIDERWFTTMDENRWDKMKGLPQRMQDEVNRQRDEFRDRNRQFAKDNFYLFRKGLNGARFPLLGRFDPTRKHKTLCDKLGYDPNRQIGS